jgi:hypothetical protein
MIFTSLGTIKSQEIEANLGSMEPARVLKYQTQMLYDGYMLFTREFRRFEAATMLVPHTKRNNILANSLTNPNPSLPRRQ